MMHVRVVAVVVESQAGKAGSAQRDAVKQPVSGQASMSILLPTDFAAVGNWTK